MIKSGLKENFKSSIVAATGSTGHSAARRGDCGSQELACNLVDVVSDMVWGSEKEVLET